MTTTNIIIIAAIAGKFGGVWGKGESIEKAVCSALEQTPIPEIRNGEYNIYLTGYCRSGSRIAPADIDVDGYGGVSYPSDCLTLELGCIPGTLLKNIGSRRELGELTLVSLDAVHGES